MLDAIVAHAQGAVALAEGDASEALTRLRHAQRIWLELDAPYEVARTRELIAQGCSALGDDEAGALELAAARELFERLGARPDLARVSTRGGSRYGLSERELEVLRLVASGKSNREIASSARHQRAHRRTAPAEHLREARALLTRRGDRLRLRARADVAGGAWSEMTTPPRVQVGESRRCRVARRLLRSSKRSVRRHGRCSRSNGTRR